MDGNSHLDSMNMCSHHQCGICSYFFLLDEQDLYYMIQYPGIFASFFSLTANCSVQYSRVKEKICVFMIHIV